MLTLLAGTCDGPARFITYRDDRRPRPFGNGTCLRPSLGQGEKAVDLATQEEDLDARLATVVIDGVPRFPCRCNPAARRAQEIQNRIRACGEPGDRHALSWTIDDQPGRG